MSSSERKRNYLRIESPKFSLELEGDPAFILETYDNVRQDILRRLLQLITHGEQAPLLENKAEVGPSLEELAERSSTESMPAVGDKRPHYVWVYVTHEIYNKVYAVDLSTFEASPLSRYLDGRRMRKLFLNREFSAILGPLVGTGKTLWSELTPKGREELTKPK